MVLQVKEYEHREDSESLPPELVTAIKTVWRDSAVQTCYTHRHNIRLVDAAQYYLDNVDRFNEPHFQPQHLVSCS